MKRMTRVESNSTGALGSRIEKKNQSNNYNSKKQRQQYHNLTSDDSDQLTNTIFFNTSFNEQNLSKWVACTAVVRVSRAPLSPTSVLLLPG